MTGAGAGLLAWPLLGAALSAGLVALMLRMRWSGNLDLPNHRSLHASPVPRNGGLGVLLGALPALALSGAPVLLGCTLALALLSWLDDQFELSVGLRFGGHIAAAFLFLAFGSTALPVWAFTLALPAVVWMTNLYNFMDGSDGMAGGMALFGFTAFGLAASFGGNAAIAAVCLGLAGAAAGFLLFNFHPARIFMGDVGSIPLGFLAAAIGIDGAVRGLWGPWFPLLVFSPFVLDASITLLRRLLRGEKVWQAHREHYYQRMVQMGLGHRQTALWWYALMAAVGASALAGFAWPALVPALLAAWGAAYLGLARAIDRRWARFVAGRAEARPA
jgi:UDP-N-acetylmuramyl pentapeptide phosphotransferase/UDP-N-acetylglucosamine-1-phosphate transferase